jgi:hypothetical protein
MLAIPREYHRVYRVAMALERLLAVAGRRIPEPNGAIPRGRRKMLAIRREHHRVYRIPMALQGLQA